MAYSEGQRLQGSDGNVYVVHGGVPVLESTAPAGPVTLGTPKPGYQYEGPRAAASLAQTVASTASSQASQAHTELETRRMAAQAPFDARLAAATTTRAEADATVAQQKADQAKAEAAISTMTANSNLHGEAYLQKFVPPAMQAVVRAYARGDLGSRSGGLSTSMLPIIQHAMNYDPSASATTFPARAKMQADLAGSQPGTAGGALRAMERMLLHGQEVLKGGQGLDNFGPGLAGKIGNTLRTGYERLSDDPDIAHYDGLVRNYAPEAQKAIAQTSGGQAERQDRAEGYSASMSQASRAKALQADAQQAFDAMGAVNDQYKRLMGRDITDQLSPAAKRAYDQIMAGGYDANGKALHPADGYRPGAILAGAGDPPVGPSAGGTPPDAGPAGGGGTIATGATKAQNNPELEHTIDALLRSGTDYATINSVARRMGANADLDPQQVANAVALYKQHPNAQVRIDTQREVPTTAFNRLASSPLGSAAIDTGAFAGSALNGASGGIINRLTDGAVDTLGNAAPTSSVLGGIAGMAGGAMGGEALLGNLGGRLGTGLAARAISSPITADSLFGAVSGANADPNAGLGQSLENGAIGAVTGGVGGMFGRKIVAPIAAKTLAPLVPAINSGLDRLGLGSRALATPAAPLAAGPAQALTTLQRSQGGLDAVRGQLAEAAGLGLPLTLADTSTGARALTGAAIRRSPTAAQLAEDTLLPRARGQIDRFQGAVTRDLGPVANIPQQSEALTQQARAAAAPLYDQAYAQSVPHTPELEAVLNTPFGRQAVAKARTIAANERRDPTELGFAQDASGNTILNPQPNAQMADHLAARATLDDAQNAYRAARNTPGVDMAAAANRVEQAREGLRRAQQALDGAPNPTQAASVPTYTQQTLDYVKRGMDDVLEQQRNPITGRLQLDEAGRAQNGVRGQLLSENDRLNAPFAQARAAYAGPVQARDALTRGQDAVGLTPDELAMQVDTQSPEHLAQMQLGYRSQLVENANNLRTAGNPFDAASTLGTPAAVSRLQTMYPNNPGVSNLLRQADLERGMARTNNKLIGNSDTAERGIADQAFAGSAVPAMVLDAGMMAAGGVPTASAARMLGGRGLRDAFTLGLGKRAVAKADAIGPVMLNADPNASLAALNGLVSQHDLYRAYINRASAKRFGGMFGAGLGSAGGSALAASGQ
jgi:hypothetical protein